MLPELRSHTLDLLGERHPDVQLARKLAQLEKELKSRLDLHETAIVEVLQRVMDILDPPPQPEPKRRQIGFHAIGDETE